jgi:hypothetical protein
MAQGLSPRLCLGVEPMFHAAFVYLSCITDILMFRILELMINSYVAPYVVVFLEMNHHVSVDGQIWYT